MKGTVKFFNRKKGFGFIVSEDGKEYFVHYTGLQQGVFINDNDVVSFDVEEGDRGPKAVNVKKLDSSATPAQEAEDNTSEEETLKEE